MTAEIAILNRSAVTLAADSAMTLSGGATDKIYNSVDKIFELSRHDPIGIMINNNLEFMRVPLELIIKRFRESSYCIGFDRVSDAAEAFFKYLEIEISASDEEKQEHVFRFSSIVFQHVHHKFDELLEYTVVMHSSTGKNEPIDAHRLFLTVTKEAIEYYNSLPLSPILERVSSEDLSAQYTSGVSDAIRRHFSEFPIDDKDRALLVNLAITALRADRCSPNLTGFVFSGYGRKEIFPSLLAFEVDGLITDKIKRRTTKTVTIDRLNNPAEIVPFAQREMVDRFLYGIDPDFEKAIEKLLAKNMTDIGTAILGAVPRIGKSTRADLLEKLGQAVDAALSDFKTKSTPEVKEHFWNQIKDTVLFMTKPDLAHFAESLVNITSIKRRVSLEKETVGGPIDVAVISKSDGFVWVKRKHYFDASLNSRYFYRKYGIIHPNLPGADQP